MLEGILRNFNFAAVWRGGLNNVTGRDSIFLFTIYQVFHTVYILFHMLYLRYVFL